MVEEIIERLVNEGRFDCSMNFKMRHLCQRMHTAVGAAGRMAIDFLFENPRKLLLEMSLHRTERRLELPSAEMRAVVFEREFKITVGWFHDDYLRIKGDKGLKGTQVGVRTSETHVYILPALFSPRFCDEYAP